MEAKNQLKAMKSYKGILTFINIVAGNRKKGEFLIYDLRFTIYDLGFWGFEDIGDFEEMGREIEIENEIEIEIGGRGQYSEIMSCDFRYINLLFSICYSQFAICKSEVEEVSS